jgi:hypothetical protein
MANPKPTTGKAKRNDRITRDMRKACAIIDLPLDQFNTHSFTYNAMTWLQRNSNGVTVRDCIIGWNVFIEGGSDDEDPPISVGKSSLHAALCAAVLATNGGE